MKKILAVILMLGLATAYAADDKKSESKKKAKPAAKSAEKSDKNVFQRTESSIGQWAHENKIWVRGASKK